MKTCALVFIFVKFWKCAKKYYEIRKLFCFVLYCTKRRCSQIKPQQSWNRRWARSTLKALVFFKFATIKEKQFWNIILLDVFINLKYLKASKISMHVNLPLQNSLYLYTALKFFMYSSTRTILLLSKIILWIKGTESLISSDPPLKFSNARLTKAHLKPSSDQKCGRYHRFSA